MRQRWSRLPRERSGGGDHVEDAGVEVDTCQAETGASSEQVVIIGADQAQLWG